MAAEGHIHHVAAREWFTDQFDASVAFCRVTQMALLRLLTNRHVMGGDPSSITGAWEVFVELRHDPRVVFAADHEKVDAVWCRFLMLPGIGPSAWTDAYLAALAQTHSYSLATFDTGFKRWSDLSLTLLEA
ncbi:MAG: TA system VapC family ribonuclease toxin [Bryobacteraceae bacterium]